MLPDGGGREIAEQNENPETVLGLYPESVGQDRSPRDRALYVAGKPEPRRKAHEEGRVTTSP